MLAKFNSYILQIKMNKRFQCDSLNYIYIYCRIFFSSVLISQISASFSWKHFKILSQKRRWGAWTLNKSQIAILKGGCEWGPSSPTPRLRVILIKFLWIRTVLFFFLEFNLDPRFEKPIKSTNDHEALNSLHLKLKLFYVHKFYSKYCE